MSSPDPERADPLIQRIGRHVELFQNGDLTVKEVVNEIVVSLSGSGRFDLVEDTVDLLPGSVLDELRKTVRKIIQLDPSYRPFTIGRPSPEWWRKVLQGLTPLAERFQSALDIGPKSKD